MLRTTLFAVTVVALSGVAQAETVKQIWNQELGEGNPGRVESPGECLQDESSSFGCWNESRDFEVDSGSVGGADEPPDEGTTDRPNETPTGQPG